MFVCVCVCVGVCVCVCVYLYINSLLYSCYTYIRYIYKSNAKRDAETVSPAEAYVSHDACRVCMCPRTIYVSSFYMRLCIYSIHCLICRGVGSKVGSKVASSSTHEHQERIS